MDGWIYQLLKSVSPSDLSTAEEYFTKCFIDCSRIFIHQVIHQPLKNISASGDLSAA